MEVSPSIFLPVLSRHYGIVTPINTTEGKKEFTALAQSLLPAKQASAFNQAIMDFGAIQCTPLSPNCLSCPLQETCIAFRENKVTELPVKQKTLKIKERHLTYIYIRCNGETAIHRRTAGDIWQGLYEPWLTDEVPSGAVLLRQNVKHVLTHRVLYADFWLWEPDQKPELPTDYLWIKEADIDNYGVPRLIEILLAYKLQSMINIAIFVSGNGTNCENLIKYFSSSERYRCALVVSNKPEALALERAECIGVATAVTPKPQLNDADFMMPLLRKYDIQFIVLAGFLPLIPNFLIDAYPRRIINIHPALLPKYGGKGMWGHHVHEAVKAAGETETGMTVHYVTPVCDSGEMIAQYKVALSPDDTADDIAAKEHLLEMKYYPQVVEKVLNETF